MNEAEPAISFGIKTNLKNEAKLLVTLASVMAQEIPTDKKEILLTGNVGFQNLPAEWRNRVRLIPDAESAAQGKLGRMMNTLVANARFENVCLLDDDIILLDGWYRKVVANLLEKDGYDALAFPIRNTDGSRFFDWVQSIKGSSLFMNYAQTSEKQYITGGMLMLRKSVGETVRWDDEKGFYQGEDVDWSWRARSHGFAFAFCAGAYVIHNNWSYFLHNKTIMRHNSYADAIHSPDDPVLALRSLEKLRDELRQELVAIKATRAFRLAKLLSRSWAGFRRMCRCA
jgi:GT2 family glycosyltransferase